MKIKLMLLPKSTYCSAGVANFDPSWRCSLCFYPDQNIVQRGWQILSPSEDKVDVFTPVNILFRGSGKFQCDDDHDVMMMMIIIIIMTIVSVEQRPGWGEKN